MEESAKELNETNKEQENVRVDEIEKEKEEDMKETEIKNAELENVSDYSSAESEGNYSDEERNQLKRPESDHHDSDTDASVILEREEGDGQESLPARKVDDDEDKKNPQYIPKRGTFYEHDDRTADDIETEKAETVEKTEKDGKKKVWQDKKENWSHDRFNDNEQAPKSRAELISIYGYDIRNEEGPPRARRRRRYGRGPNKYTRNWEDEDAYSKPPLHVKRTPKKSNSKKDTSSQGSECDSIKDNQSDQKEEEQNEKLETSNVEQNNISNNQNIDDSENIQSLNASQADAHPSNKQAQQPRVGTGRVVKPKREVKNLDYRGFTKPRNFDAKKTENQKVLPKQSKKEDYIQTQNFTNRAKPLTQDFEKDMSKLSINEGGYKNSKFNNQRQTSVPPRLQNEPKGSKRYSSMRQRSLPETNNPNFNQHSNYYQNDYNQQNQSNSPQQQPGIIPLQNNQIHGSTTQMPQIPPPPLAPLPQPTPVTTTPILQAPPQFAANFPQPPPNFLQPGPPPFLPQQTPQIINYVQGQPQFPQPPFQGFQQQFNPVSQPTELYQPQGGITYYSPQDQQLTQRAAPLKRPKAAIPIVPPPPHEPRGRGRYNINDNINPGDESVSNSMQETNSHNFEDALAAVAVEQ